MSYEVALSLALLHAGDGRGLAQHAEIVKAQQERGIWFIFDNYGFMASRSSIYLIAATAEANRTPFDLPEAESELVAGFHTEYSGFRWALYLLGEYANMFVVCCVAVTLFLGGWLRPFPNVAWLDIPLGYIAPALMIAGPGLASFYLARKIRGQSGTNWPDCVCGATHHRGVVVTSPDGEPRRVGPLLVLRQSRGAVLHNGLAARDVTAFSI